MNRHTLETARLALRRASKLTGYSIAQLRQIRRDAARDAVLDRQAYREMSRDEREAHDNQ